MGAAKCRLLAVATETTYGVDPTGEVFVPAFDQTVPDQIQEILDGNFQRDSLEGSPLILGNKGGTGLNFKTFAYGLATASGASQAPVLQSFLGPLFLACGYTSRVTGSYYSSHAESGSTSTVINVHAGDGAKFGAGDIIGWSNGTTLEAARVTSVATDAVTVAPALSGAPAENDVILRAYTYTPPTAGTAIGDGKSCTLYQEGDGWTMAYTGCTGTVKLGETDAKGRTVLEWSFSFDACSATTNYAISVAYPSQAPIIAKAGKFTWNATAYAVSKVGFDPGLKVVDQGSTAGTNGRAAGYVVDVQPVGSFQAYNAAAAGTASTYLTDALALAERAVAIRIGGASQGALAIIATKAQITKTPTHADVGEGIGGQVVPFKINASGVTNLAPFSIGIL